MELPPEIILVLRHITVFTETNNTTDSNYYYYTLTYIVKDTVAFS